MKTNIAILLAAAIAFFPAAQAIAQPQSQTTDEAVEVAEFSSSQTTIGDLLANPATRAVLEKHVPELVENPGIQQASAMTLQTVRSYAPDMLTDDKLAAIDADLAEISQD